MKKHSAGWYGILIVSVLGLAGLVALLLPQVRLLFIDMAERYIIHRKVNYPERWMSTLTVYMRACIAVIVIVDFFALHPQGQRMAKQITNEAIAVWKSFPHKKMLKSVLLMSCIYVLGISAIIRANFLYIDDMGRTVEGYKGWINWSRYITQFLSIVIHTDVNLTDISPLPQLIAVLFIAVSSVLLVYILCGKKITVIPLLASVVVGLSPYFLGCLSFKFDAPYMALSVLMSILPFLFAESGVGFVVVSAASLLIMCMTYQASSGIYLLMIIALCFQQWNTKQRSSRQIALFALRAAATYAITLVAFRLLFMVPKDAYVSTGMFSLYNMIPGVITNLKKYTLTIYADFAFFWKILSAIIGIGFIVQSSVTSKQNKAVSAMVAICTIGVAFVLSAGAYLALEVPEFGSHSMYGFGIFIAIIAIILVSYQKRYAIIILILNYSFFVFAFSYGNALADQKRYVDFRTEILLQDLNRLFPTRHKNEMKIQLENGAGYAPSITNIAKHYPFIKKLVPQYLSEGGWGTYYLVNYYNWGEKGNINAPGDKDATKTVFIDFTALNLPTIYDSYYHTLKSDGERILVVLKNGK